jgi:hypothetical protein
MQLLGKDVVLQQVTERIWRIYVKRQSRADRHFSIAHDDEREPPIKVHHHGRV